MRHWIFMIIAFLAGLLAGLGLSFSGIMGEESQKEVESVENVSELPANEAMLLDRIREKDAEIARLKADLASAAAPVEDGLAEEVAEAAPPEPDPGEDNRPRFMQRMEERISRRSGDIAARYGLSEAQTEALNAVFMARFEAYRARRMGEDIEPFNLDDAVAEVLTEEQFEQYLEDSQQEIYERAELMATTQLVRLNQRMELTPEVQDEVYETIHYAAQEMMIARQTGEDFNIRQAVDERLGTILTAEQMQAYEEIATSRPGRGRGPGPGP